MLSHDTARTRATQGPSLLDSGASITTVGRATRLEQVTPSNLILKMTGGQSSRCFEGIASFTFMDVNNWPVTLSLPSITSPDVDSDVVLISYCQLLKMGYTIRLSDTGGMVITPDKRIIKLIVRNNTWQFPTGTHQSTLRLDTKACMVLGQGTRVAFIRKLPLDNNNVPAKNMCIDPEPKMEDSEPATTAPTPLQQLLSGSDSNIHEQATSATVQAAASNSPLDQSLSSSNEQAIFVQTSTVSPTSVFLQETEDVEDTVEVYDKPTELVSPLQQEHIPGGPSTSSPSQVHTPLSSQQTQSRSQRVVEGSALTQSQAHDIIHTYHSASNHPSKSDLLVLLRQEIKDPSRRPSKEHIETFVCADCVMAKSKKPPQRTTHPSRFESARADSSYAPGESLHVDGSGAFKFETIDNSTQYFIIVDESSHAKFSFPTSDKRPATLVECLKELQAAWQTPIRKIRTDTEFSKDKDLQQWARDHSIKIETNAPYIKQHNGMAERNHGMVQDVARTQLIEAGASNFLWPYSTKYAAKQLNQMPTKADSQQRSPLNICPDIPYQHTSLTRPPFGCQMFAHIGKRTDRNSATATRAKPGVFVGIADTGPIYLMYDIDKNQVVKVGYATFDASIFPLKQILLAGQPLPNNFAVDPDTFRQAGLHHPNELTDSQVAEYAARLRIVTELPPGFVRGYPGAWRAQCSLLRKIKKVLHMVLLLDRYHGDKTKAPMLLRNETQRKVVEVVVPVHDSAETSHSNLRFLLQITYPECLKMADMAVASYTNKAILPTHPAVARQQVASAHASILLKPPLDRARAADLILNKERVPPINLSATENNIQGCIGFTPKTSNEARRHPSWPLWQKAQKDELAGLERRGMWTPVSMQDVPSGTKVLRGMFVYADKASGPKARFVVCGNGEDPQPPRTETYASTPTSDTTKVVLLHAAEYDYDLCTMDVSQAFTQAEKFPPSVRIYMYPPPGYLPPGQVLRLQGPLYGLTRAPAYWSRTVKKWLIEDGWKKVVDNDDTLWYLMVTTNDGKKSMPMYLEFHVDDFLLSSHSSCSNARDAFKSRFMSRFEAKDGGPATRFIGLDIARVGKRIYVTQAPLVQKFVEDLNLQDANPTLVPMVPGSRLSALDRPSVADPKFTKEYQHLVGILQYLHQNTRPDVGFVTHELSRHQSCPGQTHMDAVKMAGRYLKGTPHLGPVYGDTPVAEKGHMWGAADSDWASDKDTRKSISANYVRWNRGPISWSCKQQDGVATSTTEAEYVSASSCAKKITHLSRLLQGMHAVSPKPVVIFEDNRGCCFMSENSLNSSRTRHIDTARHNVRDLVEKNEVRLVDCPSADNPADILTKALPAPLFQKHRDTILGYTPLTAPIPSSVPAL